MSPHWSHPTACRGEGLQHHEEPGGPRRSPALLPEHQERPPGSPAQPVSPAFGGAPPQEQRSPALQPHSNLLQASANPKPPSPHTTSEGYRGLGVTGSNPGSASGAPLLLLDPNPPQQLPDPNPPLSSSTQTLLSSSTQTLFCSSSTQSLLSSSWLRFCVREIRGCWWRGQFKAGQMPQRAPERSQSLTSGT